MSVDKIESDLQSCQEQGKKRKLEYEKLKTSMDEHIARLMKVKEQSINHPMQPEIKRLKMEHEEVQVKINQVDLEINKLWNKKEEFKREQERINYKICVNTRQICTDSGGHYMVGYHCRACDYQTLSPYD